MLAIGLKNSILFLLIVLIIHVLIKNAIIDRNIKEKFVPVIASSPATGKEPRLISDKDIGYKDGLTPAASDINNNTSCKFPSPQEEDELYDFVYGKNDDLDLDKFFKDNTEIKQAIQEKLQCKVITKNCDENTSIIPQSTTCDPGVVSEKLNSKINMKPKNTLNQNLSLLTVKEYEDENSMNGGTLLGGQLNAFDNFASVYDDYTCLNT